MKQLDKKIILLETLINLVNELRNKKFPVIKHNEKGKITIISEKYTYDSLAKFIGVTESYLYMICHGKKYISNKQIEKFITEFKKL